MVNDKRGVNVFDPPPGMARSGSIVGSSGRTINVQLTDSPAIRGKIPSLPVPRVFPLSDSSGMFIGSYPTKGTTVTLVQSLGGQYHIVNYEPENNNLIPNLTPGELRISSTETSKILLDLDSNVTIGSDTYNIHVFAGSQKFPNRNLVTLNFQNENHFTQAYREVGGIVKRDLHPNPQATSYSGSTKLIDDSYDNILQSIGMDPTATVNNLKSGPNKNPALVEHREMVYEFQYDSNIDDDTTESNKYTTTTQNTTIFTTPNRRTSRSDTLSLSLVSPNYLIENVEGTVVDIFGNILDLNRVPLPVGLSAATTFRSSGTVATTDAKQSYINIRALQRKSIAYHFEVNARKDPTPTNQGSNLDINSDNYNAKLQRSRFFFDIDKEGQFKLNVPASSETGNVPLLVRPENYSSFGTTDSGNPNQLWFLKSGQPISQDIFVDSFAAPQTSPSSSAAGFSTTFAHGSITLKDGTSSKNMGPPDRISQFVNNSPFNIKHGTAHHDILQICSLHQNTDSLQAWQLGTSSDPVDTTYITALTDLVKGTITVSGTGANAGGRSGSINLDGSLELNIGANTVDRQSLWLDTAGGIVASVGRDRNNRSALVNFDGDVFMQVGGLGPIDSDQRFAGSGDTIPQNGTLDLRIYNGGYCHMFRIDKLGITIMSPSTINIYSAQGVKITSDADISIDAETLTLNGRMVLKSGQSI